MADRPAERGPDLREPTLRLNWIKNSPIVKALGEGTTQLDQMGILQGGLHPFGHHKSQQPGTMEATKLARPTKLR
jgi:hypothetical protein